MAISTNTYNPALGSMRQNPITLNTEIFDGQSWRVYPEQVVYVGGGGGGAGGGGGIGGGTYSTNAVNTAMDAQATHDKIRRPFMKDLEDSKSPWNVPIAQLADLWVVKFGNDWVSKEDLDDDFYAIAASRLRSSGRLEEHLVADRLGAVLRIIE